FVGTYDLLDPALHLMAEGSGPVRLSGLGDPKLDTLVKPDLARELRDGAELAGAYPDFDPARFLEGTMTPVYFGSALRDFGIGHLLEGLARFAPPPRAR
ncbi:peptide chain release factor 3, partial [Roseomonas sp. DSM 102946]|nr:peptide chain release factor 3 [Roseomonas sp. DSM 102946]